MLLFFLPYALSFAVLGLLVFPAVRYLWDPNGLRKFPSPSLFGHAGTGRPCAAVVALDLANGTPRWTTRVDAPDRSGDSAAPGLLAVAGDRAVLQERTGWRAVNLADGRPAWGGVTGPGCTPLRVAGGADVAVTVADCGTAAPGDQPPVVGLRHD